FLALWKPGAGHARFGPPRACCQPVRQVPIVLGMFFRAFRDLLGADEAQRAISDRQYRRRAWQPIDHRELTHDRAETEHAQNPLLALGRGHDDLEQALLEPIATVARISGDE